MPKFLLATILFATLIGCAGPKVWHRPGSDADELSATQRECRQRVMSEMRSDSFFRRERANEQFRDDQVRRAGTELSARARMQEAGSMKHRDNLFLDCMHSKGYSRVSKPPAS